MGGFFLLVELHHEGSALQPAQQACFYNNSLQLFILLFQGELFKYSTENSDEHQRALSDVRAITCGDLEEMDEQAVIKSDMLDEADAEGGDDEDSGQDNFTNRTLEDFEMIKTIGTGNICMYRRRKKLDGAPLIADPPPISFTTLSKKKIDMSHVTRDT